MVRETWSDILAYYENYVQNMQPILEQTKRFILDISSDILLKNEILEDYLKQEEKRSVKKVKAIGEFTALYRRQIFNMIFNYIEETKDDFESDDIKDYILDFLDESISALKVLEGITNPDQVNLEKTLLFRLSYYIQQLIFPQGNSLEEIYNNLIEKSVKYYEVQRYLLKPSTYYRDAIEESEIPGLSPIQYKIVNEMTSIFNLDPNYLEMPEDKSIDIPVILKDEIFEPFIDSIANKEENAINRILKRFELRLLDGIFIGPTETFIKLTEPHNYLARKEISDDKIRIIPQFSNETLVLMYLAKISYRRGFISKELINWISSNFAFIIYKAILKIYVSDENIFYPIFTDLLTEEKILPFLMKLLCFENYLRIDRTKIRDSVQYRKEIFNSLGAKIESIDRLTEDIAEFLGKIINEENK